MNNTYYPSFGDCAKNVLEMDSEIFIVPPNIDANVTEANIVIDSTKKQTTHFYKLLRISVPKTQNQVKGVNHLDDKDDPYLEEEKSKMTSRPINLKAEAKDPDQNKLVAFID